MALVKLKQQKYKDERGKNEERYRQFVKDGMKPDPISFSHPSEIGERWSTDLSDDATKNPKPYSLSTSRNSSEHYVSTPIQPARTNKFRHQKTK